MRLFNTILFLLVTLFSGIGNLAAQDSSAVQWTLHSKKIADKQYEISLTGSIRNGWHLYAKDSAEGLAGISLLYNDSTIMAAEPVINATFTAIKDPVFENTQKSVTTGPVTLTQTIRFTKEESPSLRIKLAYETGDKDNFIPEEQKLTVTLNAEAAGKVTNRIKIPSIDLQHSLTNCGTSASLETSTKSTGLWKLFLLGFLGGLVALLTPCVFPMIPLTVSFFTKKATSKKAGVSNAFLYGFFIFLIYVLLSLPFHFLDKLNPEILNNISTNVYLNVFFFVIFLFFAYSFFGFYEITLPAGLSSKADSKASVGNIMGIFFMALTLALVSFSCTGPILGSLLAGSLTNDGGAMQLTMGMGGFGLALALPFGLFALFPNWLNSLPKSGGWLNTVKVVLGFFELALAFKFLSNADLVKHWGLLKREIFIGLWIVIGVLLTLYLLGKIRFPHDSPLKKLARGRVIFGLAVAAFTVYLLPGVTNTKYANLKLISGFPPPLYYSIYAKDECVLGLNCSHDYEEGLKMAKAEHKPILLDFTGYACVNCRRMEENVWSQDDVYRVLKDSFIVISLYVDDKKQLPAAQQFSYTTKEGIEKDIVTVGDKWSTFETENFSNNSQPLYALLNTDEVLLARPVGYTPSAKEYLEWLRCGLQAAK